MNTLVILAAGLGSRFGGNKQLAEFSAAKLTLMECNICHAIDAGFTKVIFIIRAELRDLFTEQILPKLTNKIAVVFVEQKLNDLPLNIALPEGRTKPLGTAHAIWCCRNNIEGDFSVINADDYYGKNAFKLLLKNNQEFPEHHLMVAFQLEKTLSEFGGVNRGFCQFDRNNLLLSIDECHDIKRVKSDDSQQKITGRLEHHNERCELDPLSLTSMNCWSFTLDILPALEAYIIDTINNYNKESDVNKVNAFECYLPNVVMQQIAQQKKAVKLLTSNDLWFGLTFPDDIARVEKSITNLHQQKAFVTLVS
ncbi:MAG: nucleotidyltransferase [Colwellia sp.]|nr:nucleotidyltransferase [Colwellia sp.]